MRRLGITLLFLANMSLFSLPPVFASSANFYYSDGPWSGRVIDSETKEPIEGAVVVAVWLKYYATPAGDSSYFLDAFEVLADKAGEFFIPKFRAFNPIPILSRIEGPDFTIYKRGYATFPGFGAKYFEKYFDKKLQVDDDALAEIFKKGFFIELPKLKTWIERIESHEIAYFYRYDEAAAGSKIPNLKKILKEEGDFLESIKSMYKYDRGKLNIPIGEIPK